jgi:hypothetical protein
MFPENNSPPLHSRYPCWIIGHDRQIGPPGWSPPLEQESPDMRASHWILGHPVGTRNRVYQFRTEEDPEVSGAADVCTAAPFTPNVYLNASVYIENVRGSDALVVAERADPVGTALACARITDFTFPPGLQQNFYAQFNLPSIRVTASGTCTLISNNVPEPWLVLAGCTLRVVQPPEGFAGGAATSLSVFNPFRLPGYSTGSRWTIQLYEPVTTP